MATKENTSTSNQAAKEWERLANSPGSPLNSLIPSGHAGDTMVAVCEVLTYLSYAADASQAQAEDDVMPVGAQSGLARILKTCRDALHFHIEHKQEGGAA